MDVPGLSFKQWFFALSAIIVVVWLAWMESLNGYFIADDVWHVPLVYKALQGEPWLIWKQFVSPYSFHECLYLMYRPLTDVTFAIDLFLFKGEAWGYHLTNVIWHAISSCLVFVLARSLVKYVLLRDLPGKRYNPFVLWKIPLVVSLLFAVYPGHAEPVCWPLPRIDSIAAAFTFASMACVLEYFDKHEKNWLIAAILLMIPGLMIKEMCATIPLIAVALFVIGGPGQEAASGTIWKRISNGFLLVWPMFVVLLCYLILRAFSLGSLIGGYHGTIGASLNDSFFARLFSLEGYWRLFHPINENVLGENSIQDLLLRAIYLILAILILVNQRTGCAPLRLKTAGKLASLLLIMILPCLQIWGITGGLIGARHAYTLCLPFLLIVVILIYPITSDTTRLVSNLRRAATGVVWATFVLFFVMSHQYARAWSAATSEIDKLRSQIEEHVSFLAEGQKLVVLGLPTGIKGFCAFYTIDFLPGLLMPPLCKTDIRSRVICIDGTPTNDRVINLSLLKTLTEQIGKNQFLVWQDANKQFMTVNFIFPDLARPSRELVVESLGRFRRQRRIENGFSYFGNNEPGSDIDSFILRLSDAVAPLDFNVLELTLFGEAPASRESAGGSKNTFVQLDPGDQSITEADPSSQTRALRRGRYAWLSWSGQSNNRGDSANPVYFPVFEEKGPTTYRINLTEQKSWLFSGSTKAFRLDLPANYSYRLQSAALKSGDDFIATLAFKGAGEINTQGLYQTNADELRFAYDASRIPGAKGVFLEVSEPYYEFHVRVHSFRENTKSRHVVYSKKLDQLSGNFAVPPQVVRKPAYYQIRIGAVNAAGDVIGSFCDPVTVSTFMLPY